MTLHRILFGFLSLFALFRPIFSTSFFAQHTLFGITLMEVFGIGSSYLFFIIVFLNLENFKLDGITVFIISFCLYVVLNLFLWGLNYKDCIRIILPFSVFFAARSLIRDENDIKKITLYIIIGFLIPIIGSSLLILMKKSLYMTVYWTGVDRYSGMFLKIHSLAHSMLVFLFMVTIWASVDLDESSKSSIMNYFLFIMVLIAIFNIYKSVTRTVFLGLAVHLTAYFIGKKQYILIGIGLILVLLFLLATTGWQPLFYDILDPLSGKGEMEQIGSGRIGGWTEILAVFFNSPLERQFIGLEIANKGGSFFGAEHNDLLSLLVAFGYIGLGMYLLIMAKILFDISLVRFNWAFKLVFFGIIISILGMNLGSNSYLTRFELGQYFCLMLAFLYARRDQIKNAL